MYLLLLKGNRINVTYAEPKNETRGGGSSRGGRYSSRPQDPPFNFDDMRQLMYNNPRAVPNAYNPYVHSGKPPRNDARDMSYPTSGGMPYSGNDAKNMQNMQQYGTADSRDLQYGCWSNNK